MRIEAATAPGALVAGGCWPAPKLTLGLLTPWLGSQWCKPHSQTREAITDSASTRPSRVAASAGGLCAESPCVWLNSRHHASRPSSGAMRGRALDSPRALRHGQSSGKQRGETVRTIDAATKEASPSTVRAGSSWWLLLVVFIPSVVRAPFSLDVSEYHAYAMAFLAHPGMSWPLEYPPTAILPMLPAAVPLVFAFAMASVGAVLYGVLRQSDPPAARTWLLGCALGGIFILCTRFDIVPSLLVVLALLAAERGRWSRAWAWTAAAAALQWFGAVLGPLWLVAEWRATGRWRWDRAVAAGGAVLASYGLAALGTGAHAFSSILWYVHRPVEIESLAATVGAVTGPLHLSHAFGSWNVLGPQMPAIRLVLVMAQIGGQGALWVRYSQGRCTLREATALSVTWLVLAGTLFSPQYLLWMLPLWALADWRPRWLVLLVCVLTTADYPFAFAILHTQAGVLLVASARNSALLALVGVVGGWRLRPGQSLAASGTAGRAVVADPAPE